MIRAVKLHEVIVMNFKLFDMQNITVLFVLSTTKTIEISLQ